MAGRSLAPPAGSGEGAERCAGSPPARRYFAYGSNMHGNRLRARVANARRVGVFALAGHALRFHKVGKDGSGKCDAFRTGRSADRVWGVVYELGAADEATLDRLEGLGIGYRKVPVRLADRRGAHTAAFTYLATRIDGTLCPFVWYKHHVLQGAKEAGLDADYLAAIARQAATQDPCPERTQREMALHSMA